MDINQILTNLTPSRQSRESLQRRLLEWFDRNQRPLPWRETRDPYLIWVSEVMLQQTTVAAVIPYFFRFLESFPTVAALASATEDQVLSLWHGLGYYRRARGLHQSARIIMDQHQGQFPQTPEAVKELPGVGRYICNAVLSQAFECRLPIVEANSQRVLARLFGLRDDPRTGNGRTQIWKLAEQILPHQRIGDFNQSLMELGSLVCTNSNPKCDQCPIKKFCVAKRDGIQEKIPPSARPIQVTVVYELSVVIRYRNQFLLGRRLPESQRWANMWEFPRSEWVPSEDDKQIESESRRIAAKSTSLGVSFLATLGTVAGRVTRFNLHWKAVLLSRLSGRMKNEIFAEMRWFKLDEILQLPMSVPQRKLVNLLRSHVSANGIGDES